MSKKYNFAKHVFSDDRYTVYKDVTMGNATYKMLLEREITGNSDNIEDLLCVNCFQFIPEDNSASYLLTVGYDGKYGCYSFNFTKDLAEMLIDIDNIISDQEALPVIKEHFKDSFENSRLITSDEIAIKFEDFGDTLYAMFDFCYEYLAKNGFHVADIKSE